jgi:hypothetical protein
MYVELGPDGGFRKPSDIDWRIGVEALKGVAIHLLHTAEHLGSTSGIEAALHEPASMDEQRAALTLLTGTIENLRAAGMDQEAVKAAINKVLKAADRT